MSDIGKTYSEFARESSDLCAFLLVCEYGKLSAAAEQMGISQPSLSQRIKNLESSLGFVLFHRHSSGMRLNNQGQRLFALLKDPIDHAASQFQSFLQPEPIDRVVIAVDHAFASFWLLEKLPQLREDIGETDICIVASQEPTSHLASESDITVFMAKQASAGSAATLLFQERVFAVCSEACRARLPSVQNLDDMASISLPLLHLNTPTRTTPWLDWSQWLRAAAVPYGTVDKGTTFNNYEMIIKAARDGQGIALAWHGLLDQLLANGDLVPFFEHSVETDVGYYIQANSRTYSAKVAEVHDWIVSHCKLGS